MCHFQVPLATGTHWNSLSHAHAQTPMRTFCPWPQRRPLSRSPFSFVYFCFQFNMHVYNLVLATNTYIPLNLLSLPILGSEHSQQDQGEEKGT